MLSYIQAWTPAQTTKSSKANRSHTRLNELPQKEQDFLNKHVEYQLVMKKYGYPTSQSLPSSEFSAEKIPPAKAWIFTFTTKVELT